ncbi:TonB-dependent receptor plug domain-containing protein [Rhizorhapis sp. SPR117]|uniref:TonB-dependent receptor plug domain-containing protein n=1 Tax=Rhizorhapis sp. SPR117 TaxID=2912611 RepID=UPI001F3829FB|nr:TonB-dependent receptor [Rhizorhapis sp. SPR117]
MRLSKYLILAATVLTPVAAHADDGDQIVVTATRDARPLSQIGQSITVVTEDNIIMQQSVAVVDLLAKVPGVSFTRNGGIGGFSSIFIRGADSEQTAALIDGVKINDPASPGGGFDFGNLLTGNIARIEVVRGSQSVLWGSQAIGGVVNMITKEPSDELAANARAEYGYRDTAQLVGNVSGKFGPVAGSIGAGYFRTDGISSFAGGTEQDGYRNFGANAKFTVTLSDALSVDLRGWYSDGKNDLDGFPAPFYSFADTNEYSKTKQFVGYSGVNLSLFGGAFRNRFAFAYTDVKRANYDPDSSSDANFTAKGENERFEYQGIADISDRVQAVFGAETETSRFRTASFGFPSNARTNIDSFYGQLSMTPINGFTATAGVRRDDHQRFGGETTFAANAVYSPNSGTTTIRASYGEGFKAPSLYQLFGDYGNETLTPETSKSWDAGVTQKLLNGAIELAATWFHRNSRNQIDFVSCFGSTDLICDNRPFGTYDNIRRTRAKGIEIDLALNPVEALHIDANYTWMETKNRDTGLDLARRPRHSLNASVDYRWPFGLSTGATVTHAGSRFDNASNSRILQGYVLVDLRASIPVRPNVEFYGRVENLFDERYATVFNYGTSGRAAYAGVRLRY